MLIESFIPNPDAVETHKIEIAAAPETVYRALWTADLGGSAIIKGLLTVWSLPHLVGHRGHRHRPPTPLTLQTLLEAGFGRLAEAPGREIVLGIAGRFWRPTGNILPFSPDNFHGPVPPGLARAVWNFTVEEVNAGRTRLSTETRVVCGDRVSRWKFRAYWLLVRPFSGLIRILMLRTVRRASEGAS